MPQQPAAMAGKLPAAAPTSLVEVLRVLPAPELQASLWSWLARNDVNSFKLSCKGAHLLACATCSPTLHLDAAALGRAPGGNMEVSPHDAQRQLAAIRLRSGVHDVKVDLTGLPFGTSHHGLLRPLLPLLHLVSAAVAPRIRAHVTACCVRFDAAEGDEVLKTEECYDDEQFYGDGLLDSADADDVEYEGVTYEGVTCVDYEWLVKHEGGGYVSSLDILDELEVQISKYPLPVLMTSELPAALAAAFPGLTRLELQAPLASAEVLYALAGLPALRTLSLALSKTVKIARPWAELPKLQRVLGVVATCAPGLTSLSVSGIVRHGPAWAKYYEYNKELGYSSSSGPAIDLSPLAALAQLASLRIKVDARNGWTRGKRYPWRPVLGAALPPALAALELPGAVLDAAACAVAFAHPALRSLSATVLEPGPGLEVPAHLQQPGVLRVTNRRGGQGRGRGRGRG